jgi:hypothetical protein
METRSDVDCNAGRQLGCQSYCCRLLVRLDPDERVPGTHSEPAKGFVDKTPDGYCVNFDRENHLCAIWRARPRVCREYTCNSDELLQIAVRQNFRTIVDLVKAVTQAYIPRENYVRVPYCGEAPCASTPAKERA